MKKFDYLFGASLMLVAMSLTSCKSSNKPADAKLYALPAEDAPMFGPESYHLHDYGFFFNNFKQNVADRIKAFMEK